MKHIKQATLPVLIFLTFIRCTASANKDDTGRFYYGGISMVNKKVMEQVATNFMFANPKEEKAMLNGYFEGNEPFWDIEIRNNRFVLRCNEDSVTGILNISRRQTHSETYAFSGKKIFGVLRKSSGNCELDITEEENPTHEIYFSYGGATYMGCGKITVQNKP